MLKNIKDGRKYMVVKKANNVKSSPPLVGPLLIAAIQTKRPSAKPTNMLATKFHFQDLISLPLQNLFHRFDNRHAAHAILLDKLSGLTRFAETIRHPDPLNWNRIFFGEHFDYCAAGAPINLVLFSRNNGPAFLRGGDDGIPINRFDGVVIHHHTINPLFLQLFSGKKRVVNDKPAANDSDILAVPKYLSPSDLKRCLRRRHHRRLFPTK